MAMDFLNPIDILELQNIDQAAIDSSLIKKSKRKIHAEIELSDDRMFTYKGTKLTTSDCERAFTDLEDADKTKFYFIIANDRSLNDFLSFGDETFFSTFQSNSLYQLPAFQEFVSPYFCVKFERSLRKAFIENDLPRLLAILRSQLLIHPSDSDTAFKGVKTEIQDRIEKIEVIRARVKDSTYPEADIALLVRIVGNYFPVPLLNALASAGFQGQLNKIAFSLNDLHIAVCEKYNATSVGLRIIEHALTLHIESVNKQTYISNREFLLKRQDQEIQKRDLEALIQQWYTVVLSVIHLTDEIKAKTISPQDAAEKAISSFTLQTLNDLPELASETREHVAISLRTLSMAICNIYDDLKTSLSLIRFASQIRVSPELREKFRNDEEYLVTALQRSIVTCYFCDKHPAEDTSAIDKKIYLVNNRGYGFTGRKVEYSFSAVKIPRCGECMKIHEAAKNIFNLTFYGSILLGILAGALLPDVPILVGGIAGTIVGFLAGKLLQKKKYSKNGVKSDARSSLSKHPLVMDRIKEGWTFKMPRA